MVWCIEWKSMVRKCSELLRAHQFCVFVCSVLEGTSNLGLTMSWSIFCFVVGIICITCLSKTHASIGVSGVDASSNVLRVTRPAGL